MHRSACDGLWRDLDATAVPVPVACAVNHRQRHSCGNRATVVDVSATRLYSCVLSSTTQTPPNRCRQAAHPAHTTADANNGRIDEIPAHALIGHSRALGVNIFFYCNYLHSTYGIISFSSIWTLPHATNPDETYRYRWPYRDGELQPIVTWGSCKPRIKDQRPSSTVGTPAAFN
jgi:hypothetical protein